MEDTTKNINTESQAQQDPNDNINVNVTVNNAGSCGFTSVVTKTMDKNIFTWVFTFLLGGLGVDRFVRGQVGMGIFKLLLGSWITLGIWPLVDWIIAMVKAYGSAYKGESDFTFDQKGHYMK